MDGNSTLGCLECFCFGHSSQCSSAFNYISVDLKSGSKLWTATNLDSSIDKTVSIDNEGYFIYNTDTNTDTNNPIIVEVITVSLWV